MKSLKLNSTFDKFIWKEKVESTNSFAKNWVEKNPSSDEKALIVSEKQTGGRGRFNRNWFSPRGGLYFSIIEDGTIFEQSISLVAGLAIAESIEKVTEEEIELKWPNDLLKKGKKIGGVLIERTNNKLIMGCGLNTFSKEKLPPEFAQEATVIELGSISKRAFLKKILSSLDNYLHRLQESSFGEFRDDWKERSYLLGKRIKVNFTDKEKEEIGLFQDVSRIGELMLKKDDNDLLTFVSGEVSLEKKYE